MRKYRVIELIKSTENADISLVMNSINKQIYIMKKIKKGSIIPYEIMLEERNRYIVRVIEIFEAENTVILEYIQGMPLSSLGRCADEREVRMWSIQLCLAVEAMHRRNVIHRDIKPSNIMLTADNRIKIIDFDIARTYKSYMGKDTHYMGTDGFAPPEQYGFAQTDTRTDIYAVGAVMYELLTNGKPLQTLEEYKGGLKRIIKKCTRLNPKERYQSISQLRHALEGKSEVHNSLKQSLSSHKMTYLIVCLSVIFAIITGTVIVKTLPVMKNSVFNLTSSSRTENIKLETGDFSEKTEPIGVSSIRVGEEKIVNGSDVLCVYAKAIKNSETDYAGKVRLLFEILDKDKNTLGTVTLTEEMGAESFVLMKENIYGSAKKGIGYSYRGEMIDTIKLIEVKTIE